MLPVTPSIHSLHSGIPCVAIVNVEGSSSGATDGILFFAAVVVVVLPNDRTVAVGTVGVCAEHDARVESETSTASPRLFLHWFLVAAVDVAA